MAMRPGRMMVLALSLLLPALAGCQAPAQQADGAHPANTALRDDTRKQDAQRLLEHQRAAADAMRSQMALQAMGR